MRVFAALRCETRLGVSCSNTAPERLETDSMTVSSSGMSSTLNRMVYDFSERVSLTLLTSPRLDHLSESISTLPSAFSLTFETSSSRSVSRTFGFLISRMKGRPVPRHLTSMSSRPIPWKEVSSASRVMRIGSPMRSCTESRYWSPVPSQDSQPSALPLQALQGQRVCGISRLSLRYLP